MDFTKAAHVFQEYLKDYDQNNDKVRLKIVHTYGVVRQAEEVCRRRNLDEETVSLAKIIALLHDIGRFEQLKQLTVLSQQPWIMPPMACRFYLRKE